MGAVDTVLALGLLGGIAAYLTNFQGFKDWIHEQIDMINMPGGGGGSGNEECTAYRNTYKTSTTAQKVAAGAFLVGVVMIAYKATGVTDAKVQSAVTSMVNNDKTAMANVAAYMNANCNSVQKIWTHLRSNGITYASKYGVALKPIPTTPPAGSAYTVLSAYTRQRLR